MKVRNDSKGYAYSLSLPPSLCLSLTLTFSYAFQFVAADLSASSRFLKPWPKNKATGPPPTTTPLFHNRVRDLFTSYITTTANISALNSVSERLVLSLPSTQRHNELALVELMVMVELRVEGAGTVYGILAKSPSSRNVFPPSSTDTHQFVKNGIISSSI